MLLPCPGFTSGLQTAEGWCCLCSNKKDSQGHGRSYQTKLSLSSQAEHREPGAGTSRCVLCQRFLPFLHLVGFYFLSLQHFLMMKKQAGWASGERCSSEEKDKELLQIFMYRKSKEW